MKRTTKIFLVFALILAGAEIIRRVKDALDCAFLDFNDEDTWGI